MLNRYILVSLVARLFACDRLQPCRERFVPFRRKHGQVTEMRFICPTLTSEVGS